jgi:2-amino-4-hydroxy-6-hydroxymethyldihydropteridine diphosphokinase
MMTKVYLLLGGNLGNKREIFAQAKQLISQQIGRVTGQSAIYETEPWGFESSDLFWNQVLEITTTLTPEEVLAQTQQIENTLGRIRKSDQYVSRIIDIDILFIGDLVMQTEKLIIPHPRIQERRFALVPLCELVPALLHPVFEKTIEQLLNDCPDKLNVEKVTEFEN